jgi:hypothetical protein
MGSDMELLQIITFSIKIFALIVAIIVLSSYLLYKLKNRNKNKPYATTSTQEFSVDHATARMLFNQEPYDNLQLVNVPVENVQYDYTQDDDQQYENPQYDNIQYDPQPPSVYQNNQPRSFGQRFKIINEDNDSYTEREPIIEKIRRSAETAPQKFSSTRDTQVFNIYDYYSSNNFEPMHKIKL